MSIVQGGARGSIPRGGGGGPTIVVYDGGRSKSVAGARVNGCQVVVTGMFVRHAYIYEEDWSDGNPVESPEEFVEGIRSSGIRADIFSFSEKLPSTRRRFDYRTECENAAVIPLTNFDEWWTGLPQSTRKNVRRAKRNGVTVRSCTLDDETIRGIMDIYNETPIRQGRKFRYFGMTFETMKRELAALQNRSELLCAFCEGRIIGFLKLVYMEETAGILHLLTLEEQSDKRTANALLAESVRAACKRGKRFLVFRKYFYGNKTTSSLLEFKRRHGFVRIDYPRYYVPLTRRGRYAIALRLHIGLKSLLPAPIIGALTTIRSLCLQWPAIRRRYVARLAADDSCPPGTARPHY